MKKLYISFFIFHFSFFTFNISEAQVIHVPADQPTIQAGINAAYNGDTVLVDPGTYLENINFNGEIITVASLFLTTQDISYISQTIIDGNQVESVVTFNNGENPLALLCGFTITNGANGDLNYGCGGGICCISSSPWIKNVNIVNNHIGWKGGGLYCLSSNPILENVRISGNEASGQGPLAYDSKYGGGIYCEQSSPVLMNVTICGNYAFGPGGGIYCVESNPVFSIDYRCNIFQNEAIEGSDIYSLSALEVILDTFTVMHPTDYYATPLNNFSFDVLNGIVVQIDADLYISPEGDNTNSGLTPDEPFRNISYAFPLIRADSSHQHNIYLAEGLYSPISNGEYFPVNLIDHVNLQGSSENGVVLNADSAGALINISYNTTNIVANLTLTGGNGGAKGGGIHCDYSSPVLENLVITGNRAYFQLLGGSSGAGGGIFFSHSSPSLNDILIENNFGGSAGGGIYAEYSTIDLTDVVLQNNTAGSGGGIYLLASESIFQHVRITNNIAKYNSSYGGAIYASGSSIYFDEQQRCDIHTNAACYGNEIYSDLPLEVVTDTFTVQNPTDFLAYPGYNFTFNVLSPLYEQASADLYVSPDGNNFNSGLTAEDPLQTIHCALSKIIPDNQNPYSIHLLEGTYSDSSNKELYPLSVPDYVNLTGISRDDVILDAENKAGVIHIADNTSSVISGLTVQRGSKSGITILNSLPLLQNMVIRENYRLYAVEGCGDGFGGGIFCGSSSPVIKNVIFDDNWASVSGGSAYFEFSSPFLIDVLISNDEYETLGCNTSSIEIINSTIIDHLISLRYGSVCRIKNSIIWNGSADFGIYLGSEGDPVNLTVAYCAIKNGQDGITGIGTVNWLEGNISNDPLFQGQGEHPYALSDDSPCIDAANPDTADLDLPISDIMGNMRIWDGNDDGSTIVDMGSYEYGSVPVGVEESSVFSRQSSVAVYPNPTSGIFDFRFSIFDFRWVSLKIYDMHGRVVATVLEGRWSGGQVVRWDASGLPAGIYFLRATAGHELTTQKLIIQH